MSVVYRCTVTPGQLAVEPGKRMAELKWIHADEAIADDKLAFDHGQLIDQAVQALRAEVEVLRFPPGLMPGTFTLGELQASSEIVLGRPLDKSSFRRRLDAAGCVQPVPGEQRTGAFRPAQLYRLDPQR